jgi:hypothetical protein
MNGSRRTGVLLAAALALAAPAVQAQDPKFEYGKKEEVKEVEWKASASAGLILTTGNARALTLSGSFAASRKDGENKVSLEGAAAYARTEVLTAVDANMNGTISESEITRATQETARNWLLKLRYDRYFAGPNSAFAAGRIGSDQPAGKDIYGGAQVGYSRQVYKDEVHELIAELGYDFTYERYVSAVTDPLSIHSARLFVGYVAKLSEDVGFLANVEALFNLNSEKDPAGGSDIGAFGDTRLVAKVALTSKVLKHIDFRFAFTAKYDSAPAPLPPFKIPFDAGFVPLADKLDAITEVALIINFL